MHVHFADETVLVHALALGTLRLLGPHLLNILEDHVAVSVKSLDTGQQLAVVSAGNQDLGVCAGGGLEERQRTGGELVLLDASDLIFTVEMQDTRLVFFFSAICALRSLQKNVRMSVAKFPRCGRGTQTPRARESGRSSRGQGIIDYS